MRPYHSLSVAKRVMANSWHRFYGSVIDAFRMAWALLYWNLRKTIFILQGRRGHAPCQDATDDNVAGCMRCNPLLDWAEPGRFRRVCPLLHQDPKGWRCSVASSGVRTYWGRVLGWYGGALLSIYLLGTLILWSGLQLTGSKRISFFHVAWPGSWHRIAEIQAEDFFWKSILAFRNGRLGEAYVALNSARMRNPDNYDAKLMMAQITMFQDSYLFSDDLFQSLMDESPAQLERTSVTYHDTLLALNRMSALAILSLEMTTRDPRHTSLWVRSLLMALRSGRVGPEFLEDNSQKIAQLPSHARMLIQAESALFLGQVDDARKLLQQPFSGPFNLHYMQAQIDGLLHLRDASGAEMLLRYYGLALGDDERQAQTYLVDCVAGDAWTAQLDFEGLMRGTLDVAMVQRLLVLLIQHPDRDLFLKLQNLVLKQPELLAEISGAAMWVTGLICDAPLECDQWQTKGLQLHGDTYPEIDRIDLKSARMDSEESVIFLINVLTLPRELVFTLLVKVNSEN